MTLRRSSLVLPLVIAGVAMLAACAPTSPVPAPSRGTGATQASTPKRITAAINSRPTAFAIHLNNSPGAAEIESLTNSGLSTPDAEGVLRPLLGEAVPSLENGLWKVLPDGRMETTWRIKPNVVWHDGVPLTAEDLVFAITVGRDDDIPQMSSRALDLIESVAAPDARTLTVRWTAPFIDADWLFTNADAATSLVMALPKHLLEQPYLTDKANFTQHPYWLDDFVGAGPYQIRELVRDSHVVLNAFDRYVLGRPKIDVLEVRFITDLNALIANILAGEVEMTVGRALSFEQGQVMREQWRGGRVDFAFTSYIVIYPQFLNTNPPIVTDARFRRALIQAVNREEMVETLMGGISSVAHFTVNPDDRVYREIEPAIVRYLYDPRRATEAILGLGYTKAADGRFVDGANQPLGFEIRTGQADYMSKPMLAATDYWQKLGLAAEGVVSPIQRYQDRSYRATFPAMEVVQNPAELRNVRSLQSDLAPLPENNFQFVPNRNYTRYANADMDDLVNRYFGTVPMAERMDIARQIVRRVTDEQIWMGLYYTPRAFAIGDRLVNVNPLKSGRGMPTWNAYEWDVR